LQALRAGAAERVKFEDVEEAAGCISSVHGKRGRPPSLEKIKDLIEVTAAPPFACTGTGLDCT
jgi:hypothetical protein